MRTVFGRRKGDEDPFAALRDGGTFQSEPTTAADIGLDAKPVEVPSGSPMPAQAVSTPFTSATVASLSPTPTAPTTPDPVLSPQEPAAPAPAASPTPSTQASGLWRSVPGSAPRRRRSSGSGWGFGIPIAGRIVVLLIVIAAVGIPLASVKNALHSIKIPSFNFGQSSTSPSSTSSPGSTQVSYLTPGNVRTALARIRRIAPGARLSLLRLASDSLSVSASRPGGAAKEIYFGPSGTSIISGVSSGQRGVPISQIRPSVIGQLVSQMHRRFHVPSRRIDYIVLSSPPGLPAMWILFTKAPSHPGYSATLDGRNLKLLGT